MGVCNFTHMGKRNNKWIGIKYCMSAGIHDTVKSVYKIWSFHTE